MYKGPPNIKRAISAHLSSSLHPAPLFLTGPIACGKSTLLQELRKHFDLTTVCASDVRFDRLDAHVFTRTLRNKKHRTLIALENVHMMSVPKQKGLIAWLWRLHRVRMDGYKLLRDKTLPFGCQVILTATTSAAYEPFIHRLSTHGGQVEGERLELLHHIRLPKTPERLLGPTQTYHQPLSATRDSRYLKVKRLLRQPSDAYLDTTDLVPLLLGRNDLFFHNICPKHTLWSNEDVWDTLSDFDVLLNNVPSAVTNDIIGVQLQHLPSVFPNRSVPKSQDLPKPLIVKELKSLGMSTMEVLDRMALLTQKRLKTDEADCGSLYSNMGFPYGTENLQEDTDCVAPERRLQEFYDCSTALGKSLP